MEFKICKDIGECSAIWSLLSPNKRLFDVWDFRLCFYDTKDDELEFIAGFDGKNPVGVVPLQFTGSKSQYNYLGGWFPERNSFFLKDKSNLPKFLEKCPENTFIEGIDPSEGRYYPFSEDEFTFYLDLSKYSGNFEEYFSSLDRKKQKNFNREVKRIPEYRLFYNRIADFDRLVELNIRQYDEDSKFHNKTIRNGIRKIAELAHEKGILSMISLEISGITEAVDIGIIYNGWYHAIIGGTNNQRIPGLGKLMTMLDIKNAIAKGAKFVDFAATSGYWKDMWNFEKEMLLKFVK